MLGSDLNLNKSALDPLAEFSFTHNTRLDANKKISEAEIKLLYKRLSRFRDIALPFVSEEAQRALNFKYSRNAPEGAVSREDLFEKFSKPFVITGRDDLCRLLYFGGLVAPAYSWFNFSVSLYNRCGLYTEVYPLKGQRGDWGEFKSTTLEEQSEDMRTKCRRLDKPPFILLHSTAVPVALKTWDIDPGFCSGMVCIGAPIYLKNRENQRLLERVRKYGYPLTHFVSRFKDYNLLEYISTEYPRNDNLYSRRCPQFVRMPVSVSVELNRASDAAIHTICRKVLPDLLYLQGSEDAAVAKSVRRLFKSRIVESPFKMVPPLIEGAPHNLQCGPTMNIALKHTADFLTEHFIRQGYRHEEIPDFHTNSNFLKKMHPNVKNFFRDADYK